MSEQSHDVPMDQIDADFEWNSRKGITDESVQSLVQSIKDNDLETPVVVRPVGDRYSLVNGFRRFRAFLCLKDDFIPAFVREMNDHEAKLANFRENGERKDLSFWEEVLFVRSTFDEDVSMSNIQRDLNKPYDWVRPRRQIWVLPETLIKLAEEGVYSARNIGELLKRDPVQQKVAAKSADIAQKRGENSKHIRKRSMIRRHVQGRKNMSQMMNVIEEKQLSSDPRIHVFLLWACGDLTKVELAAKLKVDVDVFAVIEE